MSSNPRQPDERSQQTAEAAMKSVDPQDQLPDVDFAMFVLSLHGSALEHLGERVDESSPPPTPELPLARQTIDMMAMLRDKTRGNLTAEESKLIDSLLYDLRMRYVERARKK